jgi:signal transduction histidine kinase/FixJ family two-component response regulator
VYLASLLRFLKQMEESDSQASPSTEAEALLTLFFERARPARVVFPVAALLLGGCLAIVMPWPSVLIWLAAVALACLLHWTVERSYRRWPEALNRNLAALACASAYGCVWALSFAWFWPESPETQRQVTLMITAALGVASVPACAPHRLAFFAWFMPVSVVFFYGLLTVQEPLSWELVVTWLLYAALLAYAVWQQHGLVRENLRLNEQYQSALHSLTLRKEEAERANLSKARFLAAASHDLRQPMQALSMFVEGLQTTDLHADQRQLVTQIRKSVGAITDSLREILDVSKLDAGVVQPRVTSFPVAQVLDRIALEMRNLAARKGLDFEVVRSRCWVVSDPLLLYRIVLNLAQNAIAYTARGKVLIGCRRTPLGLRIEVWDTGIGIPAEQRDAIFKEYVRLHGPNREGLGLGLAICDRLARLLTHQIEVRSQLGHGSVFMVQVPRAEAHPIEPAAAAAPENATLSLAGRSVVLVDDDADVLSALSAIIERWGGQALSASSRTLALEKLGSADRVPDLIIADYQLAEGDTGVELIEAIRHEFNAQIPALLLTADTSQDRAREAYAHQLPVMYKPVSPQRLRAMIGELLDTGEQAPAMAEQAEQHINAARE